MAGDPSNVFPIEDFKHLTSKMFQQIQKKIKEQMPAGSRRLDVAFWWRNVDPNDPCTSWEVTEPTLKCNQTDCADVCDKWNWTFVDCDDPKNAGQTINVGCEQGKPSTKPGSDQYDRCPQHRNISCPAKSTKSTKRPRLVKTLAPVEPSSGKDSLPVWVYAVIVVLLIVSTVVAAVVVLVVRKRKRREALAAQRSKEKSEKSRRGGESQSGSTKSGSSASKTTQFDRPAFEMSHGRLGDFGENQNVLAILGGDESMRRKKAPTQLDLPAFEMSYGRRGGKGKDRNVLANLRDESMRETRRTRKKARQPVKKSSGGPSMKSTAVKSESKSPGGKSSVTTTKEKREG